MTQPTSWPWVLATMRSAPARLKCGASRPRGAAAPNQTAVQRCLTSAATMRRRALSVGRSRPVGCLITGNGWSASNAAAPGVIRRVHDDRTLRLPNRDGVYERLDSAYSRRKVVRHDERSAHGFEHRSPGSGNGSAGAATAEAGDIGPDKIRPPAGGGAGGRISRGGLGVRLTRCVARQRCSACRKRR